MLDINEIHIAITLHSLSWCVVHAEYFLLLILITIIYSWSSGSKISLEGYQEHI